MRILKYLFLLLLLSLVALSIFIATQKGAFKVEKSRIINSQKSSIFNYANDLKNWKEWNSVATEDASIAINYSNNTIGSGSYCSWNGALGTGELKIIRTTENDSIHQTLNYNGNEASIALILKDTLGKTKVTWKATGTMSFLFKIKTVFDGGAGKIFGNIFEKSLSNLDKRLDYEIKTHKIIVNGLIRKQESYYIAQRFTSTFSNIRKNISIVFSNIDVFCKSNGIKVNGKPFVIYHTYDTKNELSKMSICIPTKEAVFITEGSEIIADTLKSFEGIKTTLYGDYSHINSVLSKTEGYIKKNKLTSDTTISRLEIYSIAKNEINNPSKWKTEFYFPTKAKVLFTKPISKPISTQEAAPKVQEIKVPDEF
jgi:hypothetical protein